MGRYIRGGLDEVVPLGTLAAKDVLAVASAGIVTDTTLISSIVATWTLGGYTPVTDSGPIQFGVAHGDYTAAEIEEYLEDAGTWNEGNKIAKEVSGRLIRQIGVFDTPSGPTVSVSWNEGRFTRTKLNWLLQTSDLLNLWVYNTGSVAVSGATGADVRCTGHANLWPK